MLTRLIRGAAIPVLIYAAAACAGDATAPKKTVDLAPSVTGTTGAVSSEPSDTTPVAAGPAHISGTVVLITVTSGNGEPADTSHVAPLAGAQLSLSQRVHDGNAVTLVPYGSTVADVHGAFSFAEVPSGYYVLKAEGPAGATYRPALAYIATSASEITVEFRLVTGM
jgi:hypothetical protein